MSMLYSSVSRGTVVLARYASCAGNFAEVTDQILSEISANEASRLTYSHASYLFHYITEDGVIYLCITDDDFERQRAFLFLEDIKGRFLNSFSKNILYALPYGMNSEFSQVLSSQMKYFTESQDVTNVAKIQGEVSQVKDILVKNIESLASRGERLELLINKTETLNNSSVSFKSTSRTLARNLWWKNVKLIIYVILAIGASIYIVGAMGCGLAWQNCT